MKRKELPPEALEFFRKQGRKGGRLGGKTYWDGLTEEEKSERNKKAATKISPAKRKARARKAVRARWAKVKDQKKQELV